MTTVAERWLRPFATFRLPHSASSRPALDRVVLAGDLQVLGSGPVPSSTGQSRITTGVQIMCESSGATSEPVSVRSIAHTLPQHSASSPTSSEPLKACAAAYARVLTHSAVARLIWRSSATRKAPRKSSSSALRMTISQHNAVPKSRSSELR